MDEREIKDAIKQSYINCSDDYLRFKLNLIFKYDLEDSEMARRESITTSSIANRLNSDTRKAKRFLDLLAKHGKLLKHTVRGRRSCWWYPGLCQELKSEYRNSPLMIEKR